MQLLSLLLLLLLPDIPRQCLCGLAWRGLARGARKALGQKSALQRADIQLLRLLPARWGLPVRKQRQVTPPGSDIKPEG